MEGVGTRPLANRERVVKRFLQVFHAFLIIFLTGCAGQRYHNAARSTGPVPGTAPVVGLLFAQPLDGRVLFPYGAREDGVTLKGMVVEGSEGQEVRAAESGQVVYVDENLHGYGKTIVLEHAQGYSTVYARNSRILVKTGEWVRRGQAISRVGRVGKGAVPQVYFEVRQNTRPLDPQRVLG